MACRLAFLRLSPCELAVSPKHAANHHMQGATGCASASKSMCHWRAPAPLTQQHDTGLLIKQDQCSRVANLLPASGQGTKRSMPWPLLVAITFDVAGGPPESIHPEWPLAAFSPALDCLAIPATSYARVIHQWARTEGMAYGTPIVAKT